MALVEYRAGRCNCGHPLNMHLYRPKTHALQQLLVAGHLQDLSDEELEEAYYEALELDREEEANGEIEFAEKAAQIVGALFVDTRKEQAVCCPNCGALVFAIQKIRRG